MAFLDNAAEKYSASKDIGVSQNKGVSKGGYIDIV